jgi:GntR family transcriptional regulator
MEFDLDLAGPLPLYQQIVERVRRLLALGALRDGDRLPTVRELALRARVNRNTAARAVQELEREGLVRTRVGDGTFVADGGSRSGSEARHALIERRIDDLVAEASGLGIPLEEVEVRLARRVRGRQGTGGER